jgi:hypothetical protein
LDVPLANVQWNAFVIVFRQYMLAREVNYISRALATNDLQFRRTINSLCMVPSICRIEASNLYPSLSLRLGCF